MRFELVDFQEKATTEIIEEVRDAFRAYAGRRKLTAIALSAPTGAGKTVMAAAVIERLMYGYDELAPDPELTVLWITDNPSLNRQTLAKFDLASDRLQGAQLVTIEAGVDVPVLAPGTVYFLNTQKLGKGARTFRAGDTRENDPWDTVGATIRARGDNFLLVIDEAHRGTSGSDTSDQTLLTKLIDGTGESGIAMPVVLGITATPKKFIATVGPTRGVTPVVVDVEDVRASGLVKSNVAIINPREAQPSDATLIEDAVALLTKYSDRWAKYTQAQSEPEVVPVMVVQLPPSATGPQVARVIDIISGVDPTLKGLAFAHALQNHTEETFGSHTVRYLAPDHIQDDPHVRVVLFKEALTTGWDCPRAEVMVSLRKAIDDTYITQLVGRMVRSPLTHKPEDDGFLDSVRLFLPHFDNDAVDAVIKRLKSGEDAISSEVTVNPVELERNATVPAAVWDLIGGLPTYTRPPRMSRNEVARLNRMAVLLAGKDGLRPSAVTEAHACVVNHLASELTRLGTEVATLAANYETVDYQTQTVDWLTGKVVERADTSRRPAVRNIDDLFASGSKRLGDSAGSWLLDHLISAPGKTIDDAGDLKLQVAALAAQAGVRDRLDAVAESLIEEWRKAHYGMVTTQAVAVRAKFDAILGQAPAPVQIAPILPEHGGSVSPEGTPRAKHLYAGADGMFPENGKNTWESAVLDVELAKSDVVAWYRNPTSGKAALAVPYEMSGVARTLYPDFLFVRRTSDGALVVDIIDPHQPNQSDTAPKWRGLARFAADHADSFGKVVAVIADADGNLSGLDLRTAGVKDRLDRINGEVEVRALFASHGFRF